MHVHIKQANTCCAVPPRDVILRSTSGWSHTAGIWMVFPGKGLCSALHWALLDVSLKLVAWKTALLWDKHRNISLPMGLEEEPLPERTWEAARQCVSRGRLPDNVCLHVRDHGDNVTGITNGKGRRVWAVRLLAEASSYQQTVFADIWNTQESRQAYVCITFIYKYKISFLFLYIHAHTCIYIFI